METLNVVMNVQVDLNFNQNKIRLVTDGYRLLALMRTGNKTLYVEIFSDGSHGKVTECSVNNRIMTPDDFEDF